MLCYADIALFLRNFKGLQKHDDYWLSSDQINEVKRHHLKKIFRAYWLDGKFEHPR